MAYALIDNSTLTSVQRILGEIPIRSKEIVDSDISAFENLIQAVLFYDDLIAIDDYKKEYREKRKKDEKERVKIDGEISKKINIGNVDALKKFGIELLKGEEG